MATKLTKRGKLDNEITYEFVCDTSADLQAIDKQYIVLGSTAIVLEGDVGFEVYMANSQKEWVNIGGGGGNGGSSEPVWVNQDIITSVPETVSQEENGETHYIATNMSLNNHIIQGNIVPMYATSDFLVGYCVVNINPSLTTSFIDMYGGTEPELNQEYYIACVSLPASMYGIQNDTINTVIVPTPVTPVSAISATEELDGDVAFQIASISDTLYIYKIPGYVGASLYQNVSPLLMNYLFSSLQPEATYDISQVIYETPQAGE